MATLPPDQLRIIRAKLITNSGQPTIENIVSVLRETIPTITKTQLISNADTILANTSGLGLIDELVQTPNVTDVLVNGFSDIWFDRGNGLEKSSVAWNSETELREFAARLAASVNRRLDDVNPFIDAQLPNGIRFHAIIPPLSRQGTLLSFRIPARHQMRLNELIQVGTIDSNIAELLKRLVQLRISFAISGNTGSGKTTILKKLEGNSIQVLDLEGTANHRGSAFGSLGMPTQPTNEMFENLIATTLHLFNNQIPIWVEDESNIIGRCKVPTKIHEAIRSNKLYFLEVPLVQRVQNIVNDYGHFDKELLKQSTQKLYKRLGDLRTRQALQMLDENNLSAWAEAMLLYYDKTYLFGMSKRNLNNVKNISLLEINTLI
jgi:hypothetical protein